MTGGFAFVAFPAEYRSSGVKTFLISIGTELSSRRTWAKTAKRSPGGYLFSIDYPYESTEVAAEFIENAPISEVDREKICHGNAERVLRLGLYGK